MGAVIFDSMLAILNFNSEGEVFGIEAQSMAELYFLYRKLLMHDFFFADIIDVVEFIYGGFLLSNSRSDQYLGDWRKLYFTNSVEVWQAMTYQSCHLRGDSGREEYLAFGDIVEGWMTKHFARGALSTL